MKRKTHKWLALVLVCLYQSCGIEADKVRDTEIYLHPAIKLGTSTYTVEELVGELQGEGLEVNTEEPLIHLIFVQEATFEDTDEIISVSTISNIANYTNTSNVSNSSGSDIDIPIVTDSDPNTANIPPFIFSFPADNDEVINSVVFNGGELIYEMNSTMAASIDYTWTIVDTEIISSGTDLTQSKLLTYNSPDPVTDSYSRSLVGLSTELSFNESNNQNEFTVELTGDIVVPDGSSISNGQGLSFELTYQDPSFEEVHGYFGEKEVEIDDSSFDMAAFTEYASSGIFFADPTITITTTSGYGVDMLLNLDNIRGDFPDGTSIVLENDLTDAERLILGPENLGDSVVSSIEINAANSNIEDIFNAFPDSLVFSLVGETNPVVSEKTSNFISDQAKVNMQAVIDIPLTIRMTEYEVDFDFGLGALSDLEEIESFELVMNVTNEMPFGGNIELAIVDDVGNVLAVLDQAFNIPAPDVTTGGLVNTAATEASGVLLDDAEIAALLQGESIVATATLTTSQAQQGQSVSLLAEYELTVELSFRGEFSIKL